MVMASSQHVGEHQWSVDGDEELQGSVDSFFAPSIGAKRSENAANCKDLGRGGGDRNCIPTF